MERLFESRLRSRDRVGGPGAPRRTLRRLVAVVLLVLVSAVGSAGIASAHAQVQRTNPGTDQVLPTTPAQLSVTFGEAVTVAPTGVQVYDDALRPVPVSRADHMNGDPDTVGVVPTRQLTPGTYTVTYRIISADSHPVVGGFAFSVGHRSAVATGIPGGGQQGSAAVGTLLGLMRIALYTGLIGIGGAAVLARLVVPTPAGSTGSTGSDGSDGSGLVGGRGVLRSRRVVVGGWWLLVVGTVGGLMLEGPYGAGNGVASVFDPTLLALTATTQYGMLAMLRLVLLLVLGLALRPVLAGVRPGRVRLVTGSTAAVGLLASISASGHAGTDTLLPVSVLADVAHLASMSIWFGGLVVLGTCLLARGNSSETTAALARVMPSFSRWAQIAVATLVATGVYASWRLVGDVPALLSTAYGWLLMFKVLLVITLVAVGNLGRRWVVAHYPSLPDSASPKPQGGPTGSGGRKPPRFALSLGPAPRETVPAGGVEPAPTGGSVAVAEHDVEDEEQVVVEAEPAPAPTAEALRALRRGMLIELVLGAVVLMVTAALVNTAPAKDAYAPTWTSTQAAGNVVLVASVAPAHTGRSEVSLATHDPSGRALRIRTITGSLSLPAQNVGPLPMKITPDILGGSTAQASFPTPGLWDMTVSVENSTTQATVFRLQVPVR